MRSASASARLVRDAGMRDDVLAGLRARIRTVEGTRTPVSGFALPGRYSALLPDGVLRHGWVYSVPGSVSLAIGLASAVQANGAWCAVVGVPGFGVEAAVQQGIDVERLVLVPQPGTHALSVASTLLDVVGVVVLGAGVRITTTEVQRVQARLRDRSASLIVVDDWPQSHAVVRRSSVRWDGLGRGWGILREREVDVAVETRGHGARIHRTTLRFDRNGVIADTVHRSDSEIQGSFSPRQGTRHVVRQAQRTRVVSS